MDITTQKWASRMLRLAKEVASWSKDQSTKVGSVITTADGRPVSWGFNGMPMGIDDTVPERNERPTKYKWFCHAERNAIDLAPGSVKDCILFVTYSPCPLCAQAIIQNEMKKVMVDTNFSADKMPQHWIDDMQLARSMLNEAGIDVVEIDPDKID